VVRFGPSGEVERSLLLTGAADPTGVAFGDATTAYVLTASPPRVLVLDVGQGTSRTFAAIPDVPPCVPVVRPTACDASAIDRKPLPWALAFDGNGNLFVADAGQGAIWRIPRGGGSAEQWLVDGSFARADRPSGPTGLAFDGAGDLVFTIPASLTSDGGAVFVQAVDGDGRPGDRRTLTTLKDGEHPAGLVLSRAGHVYLSLPGLRQVVALGTDGKELRRLSVDASLATGDLTGLVFRGDDLLAAGRVPTGSRNSAIVRLPVGEAGGPLHGDAG
jgi:hypothetical protein